METDQKEVSFVNRDQIEALEMEIAALPAGYISRKTINGKVKLYHQWTENGKKKSKYPRISCCRCFFSN